MRQVVVLLAVVFLYGINCFAQNESKFKSLKDNINKSDAAIQDPKKESNPKTWMDRGKLFQEANGVNVSYLRFGMPTTEVKLYFKDPKQVLTKEVEGAVQETYEYSQINVFFENGAVKSWEETQTVTDNPLGKAVSAYEKAKSLDEKGKNEKKIIEAYKSINNDVEMKALNAYTNQKFKEAYDAALLRIEVSKLLGVSDTLFYYYAGYFAYAQSEKDSSLWKQAVDYFEKAVALGFKETGENKGLLYTMLYQANMNIGDQDKALKYAKEGFEKYPESIQLIYTLINYYLQRGESREALDYVEQAKAKESAPNPNLLFAEGALYDKLGEKDKAISAYNASIAADPNKYDSYYNKAVVYYNSAIKLMDDANGAKTNDEFEKKKDIAEAEFMRAIPPLEKAHELNPNEREIMETLKTLYYRLKTKYPELDAKYNDITKKLESF